MIHLVGLTYDDVKFLSTWAGQPIDFHAATCAALGHSSEDYQKHLEALFDLEYQWRASGGELPIDERQKVFPPEFKQ